MFDEYRGIVSNEISAASLKLKTGPEACVGPPGFNFAVISIRD
jgi:hypothetical protein